MTTLAHRTIAMFLIAILADIAFALPFHDSRSWASNVVIYDVPLVAFAFFGLLLFAVVLPFLIYRRKYFSRPLQEQL